MNVTFLIGNGFDLNLGLKTRYADFYKYYKEKKFDDMISKSIATDFKMWSDLEMGLGAFLKDVDETQIDEFLDSKSTLERTLAEYLTLENDRMVIDTEPNFAAEFSKNTVGFWNDFNLEDKEQRKRVVSNTTEEIQYQFISFNYTNSLDRMISVAQTHKKQFGTHVARGSTYGETVVAPLHIHGILTDDLILGLDNVSQIQNEKLAKNPALADYIIKASVNKALGERRIEQAKAIIDKSKYVCLFGLSIGETDGMWWEYLVEWLNRSEDNRLVLFVHGEDNVRLSAQEKVRFRDRKRKLFLERSKCKDENILNNVRNRIIVVPNSKIFSMKNVSVKNTELITIGGK